MLEQNDIPFHESQVTEAPTRWEELPLGEPGQKLFLDVMKKKLKYLMNTKFGDDESCMEEDPYPSFTLSRPSLDDDVSLCSSSMCSLRYLHCAAGEGARADDNIANAETRQRQLSDKYWLVVIFGTMVLVPSHLLQV